MTGLVSRSRKRRGPASAWPIPAPACKSSTATGSSYNSAPAPAAGCASRSRFPTTVCSAGVLVTIRTLVVDDSPLARQPLRTLLAPDPDLELIGECGDGRQAVTAVQQLKPDLMFLDVEMPALDGFEVLHALAGVALPVVVFVTAHDRYALRAFEAHALDYLLKP